MNISRKIQAAAVAALLSFTVSNAQAAWFTPSPILLPPVPDLILEAEEAIKEVVEDVLQMSFAEGVKLAGPLWCTPVVVITCV